MITLFMAIVEPSILKKGTKAAANYEIAVDGEGFTVIRLRLVKGETGEPFHEFDKIFDERKRRRMIFMMSCKRKLILTMQNWCSGRRLPE